MDSTKVGVLRGRVAIVSGASSGIGETLARAMAAEGADVAALARRRDRLHALVSDTRGLAGRIRPYVVDVGDADQVAETVEQVVADLGRIDVLVNNAGYGMWGPAADANLDDWRRMIDVNLTGALILTRHALPHLTAAARTRGVADVVNVSSIAGKKVPASASNVYAATKHAIGAFSEALRQELSVEHVRVGVVAPGVVVTELTTKGGNNAPDATSADGFNVLQSEDVVDSIIYMITRPPQVAVNEMVVRPTEQVI